MGKASSAKKVARAARTGGKSSTNRRNVAFPAALAVLVVLGVGLVVFARGTNPGGGDPELGAHWHSAYGIYICDSWVTNLSDRGPDTLGIHTHDDGVIHIHPFLSGAAGSSATLGKFFDQVGVSVGDDSIELPPGDPYEGRTYEDGETTCGDQPGRVVAARWDDAQTADGSEPDEVFTSGISGQHFENDGSAFTIAFVPDGEDIPPPLTAAQLAELGAVDGGQGGPIDGVPSDNELPEGDVGLSETDDPSGTTAPVEEVPGEGVPAEEVPPETTEAPAGG